MSTGFASTTPDIKLPGVSGWPTPQEPPKYAKSGPKPMGIPEGAMTLTKTVLPQRTPTQDVYENSTATTEDKKENKGVGARGIIATSVLLIGGAILGYGHRNQISKGLNSLKNYFSTGKLGEYLEKGKDLLAKGKDLIMAKKA